MKKTERLWSAGNGKIIITGQDVDISVVTSSCRGYTSFASLALCRNPNIGEVPDGFRIDSRRVRHVFAPKGAGGIPGAIITDCVPEGACAAVRLVRASFPLEFLTGEFLSEARPYTGRIRVGNTRVRCFEIGCPDGQPNQRLLFALLGAASYDGKTVTFGAGIGRIIIAVGAQGEAEAIMKKALRLTDEEIEGGLLNDTVSESVDDFIGDAESLQWETGGFAGSPTDPEPHMIEQFPILAALITLGRYDPARSCADYLFRLIQSDTERMSEGRRCTLMLSATAAAVRLGRACPGYFDDNRLQSCLACLEGLKHILHGGALPFDGDEDLVFGDIIPPGFEAHGSALATAIFIYVSSAIAGEALRLGHTEAQGFASACSEIAVKEYARNFIYGGTPVLNSPRRLYYLRRKRYEWKSCPFCCRKGGDRSERLLEMANEPQYPFLYLCPDCRNNSSFIGIPRDPLTRITSALPTEFVRLIGLEWLYPEHVGGKVGELFVGTKKPLRLSQRSLFVLMSDAVRH